MRTSISSVQHYILQCAGCVGTSCLLVNGFLPANDPRVLGTIKAVEQGLLKDGLVPPKLLLIE